MMKIIMPLALAAGAEAQFGLPGGGNDGSSTDSGVNCCGGGSACGYVHCAALGQGTDGCIRSWELPTGMTMDDCNAQIAVDTGFIMPPPPAPAPPL